MLQQTETSIAVNENHSQSKDKQISQINPFQCLILSSDPARSEQLSQSATSVGWDVTLCNASDTAAKHIEKHAIQFALIDLGVAPTQSEQLESIRSFVQQLAEGKALLAICGNENAADEEIWARQLGVWFYAPGIDAESDLATVCDSAKDVVEKLAATTAKKNSKPKKIQTKKSNRALFS